MINLIWYKFIEGKEEKEIIEMKQSLQDLPYVHPLLGISLSMPRMRTAAATTPVVTKRTLAESAPKTKKYNPIMGDPISSEVNTIVQRESPTNKKVSYIPPWYLGEKTAFKKAQQAQKGVAALPKSK